jgi:hypothetical protein
VSTELLVPGYYDGQDRSRPPVFLKTRAEIKQERRDGVLDGWYQEHATVFVIFKSFAQQAMKEFEELMAAGNMSDAWAPRQSGYAGPLVLQMQELDGEVIGNGSA